MVDGESYLKLDEMSKSTVEQEDPIKIGLRKRIREIKSMKDIKELDDLGEIYYKNDNLMSEPEIKFDIDNYTIKEYLEEGENFYPLLECLLEEESQNTSFPLIQFIERFRNLHDEKVKSMNLEQINLYCKDMLEFIDSEKNKN